MTELKPCPFCGGEAFVNRGVSYSWCECRNCGAVGMYGLTDFAAVEAWNRRHVETCTIECNESGCNFAYRLWTLSCGHSVWTMGDAPNYCMACGKKVEQ